jgi:F-type H+-transporting ATPase subunit alpha
MPVANQVAILYAAVNGLVDDVPVERIKEFENAFQNFMNNSQSKLLDNILQVGEITEEIDKALKQVIDDFKKISDFTAPEKNESAE